MRGKLEDNPMLCTCFLDALPAVYLMEILPRARKTDLESEKAMHTKRERCMHVLNCPSDVVPDNVLVGVNVERYAVFVGRKGRNSASGRRGRGRGQKC